VTRSDSARNLYRDLLLATVDLIGNDFIRGSGQFFQRHGKFVDQILPFCPLGMASKACGRITKRGTAATILSFAGTSRTSEHLAENILGASTPSNAELAKDTSKIKPPKYVFLGESVLKPLRSEHIILLFLFRIA